jgi:hypothetical protein
MSSPPTLWVGAVTGIVGAITGLAGFVLGCINYRRLQQIKALDLRLELRKQVSDLRAVVESLPDLLEQSRASRITVLAHMGWGPKGPPGEEQSPSIACKTWMAAWESDFQAAKDLVRKVPDPNETFQHLKHQDLETKLVEVHDVARRATELHDKYRAELAADDKLCDDLRTGALARGW